MKRVMPEQLRRLIRREAMRIIREDSEGRAPGGGSMQLSTALQQLHDRIQSAAQTSSVLQTALSRAPSGGAAENILVEVTLCSTALKTALTRIERAIARTGD